MSKVVFVGQVAGLLAPGEKRRNGGDANEAANYELYCSCESKDAKGKTGPTFLGPLARFQSNAEGARSAVCNVCHNVTAVDKQGQIIAVVPLASFLAKQKVA